MATDDDPDELVQLNARVPRSLRDRIDARRAGLIDRSTGKPMSQAKWLINAAEHALANPRRTTTNTRARTVPPARS